MQTDADLRCNVAPGAPDAGSVAQTRSAEHMAGRFTVVVWLIPFSIITYYRQSRRSYVDEDR